MKFEILKIKALRKLKLSLKFSMKIFLSRGAKRGLLACVLSGLLLIPFQDGAAADENLRAPQKSGIQLFQQGKYEEALEEFRRADTKQPSDVQTKLWLGLALEAEDQSLEAMAVWRSGNGNPAWEPIADYLKGLSWWKMGRVNDATACFKDALVNLTDGKAVKFPPATSAIAIMNAGEAVPAINLWPELSTLSQTRKANSSSSKQGLKAASKPASKKKASKKTTAAKKPVVQKPAQSSGTKPRSGKWVATVSNGYKGDTLTFRVSADGKRIENVEFKGYWRSSSGMGPEVLLNLDPPSPFSVMKGAFSAVQQVPKSRMWWDFNGHFLSATSAEGTYRCAYAGGQNDTYKLKWTARYISSYTDS